MKISLVNRLFDDSLNTMNFLNEVVMNYPKAISFAPGRPVEDFFDVEDSFSKAAPYVEYMAQKTHATRREYFNSLGQYGKTNGQIQELLVDYLAKDENIHTDAQSIIVTNGCQEGMALLLMGLFNDKDDVLLVSDPSYIGITGLAQVLGLTLHPIPVGEHGLEPQDLQNAIDAVRKKGQNPVAVYDIPDFNNPLGTSMPVENRQKILDTAKANDILIFEDNPYGMFAFDGKPAPTLKSMDKEGIVIYMGTVSKTLYPGLRLGYLVTDQTTVTPSGDTVSVASQLSKIKSFVSVNTSALLQAIVGGILLENQGSLMPVLAPKVAFYKQNRDHMVDCLKKYCAEAGIPEGTIRWNKPGGGFFLTVYLPFEFDEALVRVCAGEYGVICCPMSMFSLRGAHKREMRLSFSYVDKDNIEKGIQRLASFIKDRLALQA